MAKQKAYRDLQGSFTTDIRCVASDRNGTDVDHVSGLLFPHGGQDGLGAADDAPEVGFEDDLGFFDIDVLDGGVHSDSRIVDQDIDGPGLRQDAPDGLTDRGVTVDIDFDGVDRGVLLGGALQESIGFVEISHSGEDLEALGRQMYSRGSSDPGVGACDEYTRHAGLFLVCRPPVQGREWMFRDGVFRRASQDGLNRVATVNLFGEGSGTR